jgi:photosystem II stability/assembly factor-like uncharacterized protein
MYLAKNNAIYNDSIFSERNTLYKSLDAGEHWDKTELTLKEKDFCAAIIINPKNNKNILCSARDYYSDTNSLYKSTDSGDSWQLIKRLDGDRGAFSYANDGKTIYHLTKNFLSKSIDNGDNWSNIGASSFAWPIDLSSNIIVDPRNADIIYMIAFTEKTMGAYKSMDGGKNWALQLDVAMQRFKLLMHPNYPDRLLLVGHRGNRVAYLTDDGGNSWAVLPESFFNNAFGIDDLVFNPRNRDGLFYVSESGVYESKDLGVTWDVFDKKYSLYDGYSRYYRWLKTAANNVYSIRQNSIAKLTSPTISTQDKDCLFNWAQQQYPAFFSPALAGSQVFEGYDYRYYNETNTYLGIFQDEKVHLLQADLTDKIEDVGFFEYFQHLAECD